jgi:hypothetical protein
MQTLRWVSVHAADVLRSLENEVFPYLGSVPLKEIDAPLVLAVLRKIEKRGAFETAKRVRQRMSAVFVHGISTSACSADPAAIVGKALKPQPKKTPQPAITDIKQLRELLRTEAEWEGERSRRAIIIRAKGQPEKVKRFVCSHFGHGILTFHPGYVFRTNPGWALWIRGCPNTFKPPIVPLEGVVETEWLPFTFTMNWKFTSPGKVIFQKDEPFCVITLTPHGVIDRVRPYVSDLQADPTLSKAYDDWRASRNHFNQGLNDPTSIQTQQGWQKRYLTASEAADVSGHRIKRRLLSPQTLEKNDDA